MEKFGRWVFIIGIVLAALAGLFLEFGWVSWVLAAFGVAVGLLNVTGSDSKGFLLGAIALTLSASAVQNVPFVGVLITDILGYVVIFVTGAMLVVALKVLFEFAMD